MPNTFVLQKSINGANAGEVAITTPSPAGIAYCISSIDAPAHASIPA